jgi:hypothetical protein
MGTNPKESSMTFLCKGDIIKIGIWASKAIHKYYVHMYVNAKMIPLKLFQEWGEGEDKGDWWREWIQVYVIHCMNFCNW